MNGRDFAALESRLMPSDTDSGLFLFQMQHAFLRVDVHLEVAEEVES